MDVAGFARALAHDPTLRLHIAEHRHIPPRAPMFAEIELNPRLRDALAQRGITAFFSHQAEAVSALRRGENVVAMTPTGSGKSLIYNLPVLEMLLEEPGAKALYLFPLKGLEQDQLKTLSELASDLGIPDCGAVYDGDTTAYRRKKIRQSLPGVIFSNPDMLHYAINAFHPKWEEFFRNLKYIVVDEIHAYRGVFGSHVAQVLRRLRRIANRWGSEPRFIACSATIANPGGLASDLTGLPFTVIEQSGAPHGGVHFLFADPVESPYAAAMRLFIKCLKSGLRTIAFTRARKITELIHAWTVERAPELEGVISPYRAGFLPAERREIEQRLFGGDLMGVITTSALELGVDVGGLDVCILVGYPGSISSTWQRAGRVGRRGGESLVVMVAMQDALDQYLMRHPEEFFGKSHEAAVVDPLNRNILKAHLPCAAKEVILRPGEAAYDMQAIAPAIEELAVEGALVPGRAGGWVNALKLPHRQVEIRAAGPTYSIYDSRGRVGELSGFRVFREAFPGAVYLHRGRQYVVEELDLQGLKVFVREADVGYYTQALTSEETEVIREFDVRGSGGLTAHEGRLRIRHRVTGFQKKGLFDRRTISRHELTMPEYVFETEGLWLAIGEGPLSGLEVAGFDLAGSLHAFEHAAIATIPLFALCDKNDIGGLSYELYPPFHRSAVFIYDGHEGGVGLSRHVFGILPEWFRATLAVIRECPCEEGCPSCVQDPMCGSGNEPLDKYGAAYLAERLLDARW